MKHLFGSPYVPKLEKNSGSLNDFTKQSEAEAQEEIRKSIDSKQETQSKGPLSKEEAEQIQSKIRETIARISGLRERIAKLDSKIEEKVLTESDNVFTLDISKRPSLKRAVRKSMQIQTNQITYAMYREALRIKRRIEREDAKGYVENGGLS